MMLAAVGTAPGKAFIEDAKVLHVGDRELAPSKQRAAPALAADLKRDERLHAFENAVVVRLRGPWSPAFVRELDQTFLANRSNEIVVDEQHGDEYRIGRRGMKADGRRYLERIDLAASLS